MAALLVSILIPTYNEETSIPATLESVSRLDGRYELIVADGGSTDRTRELAAPRAGLVELSSPHRARQLNAAARLARGDVLWFLHADVRVRRGAVRCLQTALRNPRVVGGNFDVRYDGRRLSSRLFTLVNRHRRPFGIFYGDSGIFCRRSAFEALGGFPDMPILEDYCFARRLWKLGRVAFLEEPILVSSRRWEQDGVVKTVLVWVGIQGLYLAGVSPTLLSRGYRAVRQPSGRFLRAK